MKILLFLCTIYYVHCNLLLSQVHAEIVEGGSHNLNTTTTTTTTTEIPISESDPESEGVTTKDYAAEAVVDENPVGEQVSDGGSETPDLKSDAVEESPADLTVTPDIQQEASELQETATENIESDAPETPDGDEQEVADAPETPVEEKPNTEAKIPEVQANGNEAETPDEEKTENPVEAKTNTEENVDNKLKIATNSETAVETDEPITFVEENPAEEAKPGVEPSKIVTADESLVEEKPMSESVGEIETKTVAEQIPDIKTETVEEPEISAEQNPSSAENEETTSEPKNLVGEKADSKEKQDDDVDSGIEFEEITEATQNDGTKAEIKIEEISDSNTKPETPVEPKDKKAENIEKEPETKTENKSSEESKIPADPETSEEQKPESAESKTDIQIQIQIEEKETKQDQKTSIETENTTRTAEASEEDDEPDNKFISSPSDITIEHIDFVQLRLAHIAKKTTSNITELRLLQAKEFEKNEVYKEGWARAVELFDAPKKKKIFKGFSTKSAVRTVPDEYHIALIAYTLAYPGVYADFNKKTREVCSGKDVDAYDYQSYFKLLLLAIEYLGAEMKFKSANRFLYRGVSSKFALEVGQVLAFQHFQSTSSSLMIAEDFAGKTLFEIQGKFDTAVSIRDHSRFQHEDEILFSPFQVYEVQSKHEGKYYTRYVLIGHELPRSSACDLNLRSGTTTQTPTSQKLRGGDKNGALLKHSSNDAHYASSSIRIMAMTGIFSLCSILASPVL